ncbi:uncharacterized protein LOC144318701 [Canis aureus]
MAAADRSGSVSLTRAPPPGVSPQEMKEAALVSSQDIMQIDLDVSQTFRSHTMFWDRYGVGQRALFHVLAAYSVYNTVSVPAPAFCPTGGLVLSAGDQRDSQLWPQLHGPDIPGRVSLLWDGQGAGCRPPRGGRACVPEGRGCPGPPCAPRLSWSSGLDPDRRDY